jgi:transcriptional regulator with XRE-family HTH domain
MKKQQAKRFGAWLRAQRIAAGYSTVRLAKEAGTTDATIVRIEHGTIAAPAPDKLSRIAGVLGLSLADVYAMAGYAVPADLPSFQPYLRRKYRDLPAGAVNDLDRAFRDIAKRHGYDPDGPKPGEDEQPDAELIDSIT